MFQQYRQRWQRWKERTKRPGIRDSFVEMPQLLDPTVLVTGAALYGPVKIHEHTHIKQGVKLSGDITIGRYTVINGPQTDVFCGVNSVHIGSFCSIARTVAIQEYNHNLKSCSTSFISKRIFRKEGIAHLSSKGAICIGNDVWIGTQCIILSGSRIGDGAVIAANSVVTGEIPPYAIAGGTPARVLRLRFPEPMIERLLALQWWDWPHERLLENYGLFEGELTLEKIAAIS